MAINPITFKTELTTDPAKLGYSGLVFRGDHTGLASIVNFRRDGSTPCPVNNIVGSGITIFRNDISPREIINAIQPNDFNAAQQIQISKLNLLFLALPIDATLSGVRANFQNIFSGSATMLSGHLTAIAIRNGSRGEQLFGTGISVTQGDIASALNT